MRTVLKDGALIGESEVVRPRDSVPHIPFEILSMFCYHMFCSDNFPLEFHDVIDVVFFKIVQD